MDIDNLRTPIPRHSFYLGMSGPPTIGANGTWLESEQFCYPNGAMRRRAYAINQVTGKHQLVRCGVADTYFSIPVLSSCGGGFLSTKDGVIVYYPANR